MKRNKLATLLISTGLILSSISVAVFSGVNVAKSVSAGSSEFSNSSLPTSLDLSDSTDSEIKSYYAGLNGKSSDELKGTNLLKNLKAIISNSVSYFSYADVSKVYVITDRDWSNSPNLTSGTTSGTSVTSFSHSAEVDANPYLHLLYCDYDVQGATHYQGDGDVSSSSVSFDKEHAWSQSHGFDNGTSSGSDLTGAGSDLHHLKAGTQYGNRTLHSNYSYGFVKANDGDWSSKLYETKNKRGTPLFPHSGDQQAKVFEPQNEDKGDIARALLYLVACYNNYDGSIPTPANPALKLVNYVISGSTTGYSSDKIENGYYGVLQDILAWHHMDPVDTYEIHRNNLIYNNYQHNRNPFIDYPEWVDYIWGVSEYDSGAGTISYNDTPTGYVNLDNDVINGYRDHSTVNVTGVSISEASVSVTANNTHQLYATVSPSNASDKSVTWSSGNNAIATISSSGLVTAKSVGSTTITVTTNDGSYTATCSLTVTAPIINVTGVSLDKVTSNIVIGATDALVATVSPSNATNKNVTWSSDKPLIASVSSSGVVTGVAEGSATITCTTEDGLFEASCSVMVKSNVDQATFVLTILPSYFSGSYTSSSMQIAATLQEGEGSKLVRIEYTKVRRYSGQMQWNKDEGSILIQIPVTRIDSCTINKTGGAFVEETVDGYKKISANGVTGYVDSIEVVFTADLTHVSGVSLNESSVSIYQKKSTLLVATFTPDDVTYNQVVWTSSDTSIATVTDGEVKGISIGSAVITATSVDGGYSATCNVTVLEPPPRGPIAKRVTSGISVGDKVIIAAQASSDASTCYVMKNRLIDGSTYKFVATSVSVEDNAIDYEEDATVWTVGGSAGAFTFFDGTNYISAYTEQNGSYYWRNIKLTDDLSDGTTSWNVRSNGFGYDMIASDPNDDVYIEYYNNHFCGYSSNNNACLTTFYKIYSADDFAIDFMDAVTCNSAGTSGPILSKTWAELEDLYNEIYSTDEKNLLKNATFIVSGSGSLTVVTPTGTTTQVIANAMSKYDYILSKYGTSSYKDFVQRNPLGLTPYVNVLMSETNDIVLIVLVSSLSLVTVAAFIILRRKRKIEE